MDRYEIDDPMHSSTIHGFCGIWSLIAEGLFDPEEGFLYTGNGTLLGTQMLGIVAYSLWAALLSYFFFFSLKENDRLRIQPFYEIMGVSWLNVSRDF